MTKRSWSRAWILVLVVTSWPLGARADAALGESVSATFQRGNEAYFRGRYPDAIAAYEQVLASDVVSEDVYFNLGNAYLKQGTLGPAIYNYERALQLDPSADDVEYNLKAAREVVRRRGEDRLLGAEVPPLWMRVVQTFSLGTLGWTFLALYVILFSLLVLLRFIQPGVGRVAVWTALSFVLLGALGSGGLLSGRLYLAERVEQAIVLPDVLDVKEGPDATYQAVFKVHAGLKVRITEHEQDWLRVRLGNGLEGWVTQSSVGRL